MKKTLKTWLLERAFVPMPVGKDHFWRIRGKCFGAIAFRPSGARDGTFVVDLKVGLVDEFMQGPGSYVFATHHYLNKSEAVYYTWSRHQTWREGEEDALIASLATVGVPHLEAYCDETTLRAFLVRGLEVGHPADPKEGAPRSLLGRLFSKEIAVGRPIAGGVPSFAYALGILSSLLGEADAARFYLREYRKTLLAPAFKDVAAAVDRRLASLDK